MKNIFTNLFLYTMSDKTSNLNISFSSSSLNNNNDLNDLNDSINNSNTSFLSSSLNESNINPLSNNNTSNIKTGPKKKPVWQHFDLIGTRNSGHQGCKCKYCKWTQKSGKPNMMEAHLALKCSKVSIEIKNIFLHVVSNRDNMNISNSSNNQQKKKQKYDNTNNKKINDFYRPTNIDLETIKLANRAIIKFFICCGIPFSAASHPFFCDFVYILHPGYTPPQRSELSQNLLDGETARVLINTEQELKHEENLTLGKFNI